MAFETLTFETAASVCTLTLNRPERLNAITAEMTSELAAAWTEIKRDPGISVTIVTGAGDRALCTGYDVSDVDSGDADVGGALRLTALQNRCWKPVITAVNGMTCGGGLHFVADSDLVICAEHATFFDTHVNVGMVAGMEPIVMARRMPLEAVLRLAIVGKSDRMSAARALELGLVGEVVPADALMDRARELASQVAANSCTAIAMTKRAIWESLNTGIDEARELGWSIIREYWGHPDIKEGAQAFREKRKPKWAPLSS